LTGVFAATGVLAGVFTLASTLETWLVWGVLRTGEGDCTLLFFGVLLLLLTPSFSVCCGGLDFGVSIFIVGLIFAGVELCLGVPCFVDLTGWGVKSLFAELFLDADVPPRLFLLLGDNGLRGYVSFKSTFWKEITIWYLSSLFLKIQNAFLHKMSDLHKQYF
jgi:hypothetical protein